MFRLLRHFSLASVGVIVVVIALLMVFFHHLFVEDLVKVGERQNEVLAHSIGNHLWVRFDPQMRLIKDSVGESVRAELKTAEISEDLKSLVSGLSVSRVEVLNLQGRVLFSTAKDRIGVDGSGDAGFVQAREGRAASGIRHPVEGGGVAQGPETSESLSTFLPIRDNEKTIVGVIEINSDIAALLADIDQHVLFVFIALSSALGLLYLVLFQVVKRADKTIKNQHMQLQLNEQELRKKEEFSKSIIENEPECIKVTGTGGILNYMNPAGLDMIEADDLESVAGKSVYPIIDPMDREAFATFNDRVLGGERDSLQFRIVGQKGTRRWMESHSVPLTDEAGGVEGALGLTRDVTKQKEAEAALMRAKDEAEAANRSKSEFLASMSHELRTPLNAILGFAQMLSHDTRVPLSPDQRSHVESILRGGNHLLELVNEILDLAKIEAYELELDLQEVDVGAAVAECVKMLTPLGQRCGIKIVNTLSNPTTFHVVADEFRFTQVMINFLSNAIKFNQEDGSVTFAGRATEDGFVRVSVTDTGIGIPADDHDRVFHMFHRLGANPLISREGTGIGLTVSKLLVERMGGRLGFESEVGVGSTFWLELPAQ